MADVGDILKDDEFFGDVVDTPKEGIEHHKKWEELRSVIDKGKAHLLGNKWMHKRVDKASDKTINKTYAEYKQQELNEKGKKLGRPWASMSLICILLAFLWWLRSGMFPNYAKTLRIIRSLKIRWLA